MPEDLASEPFDVLQGLEYKYHRSVGDLTGPKSRDR